MRLLILWPDYQAACGIRNEMERQGWDVAVRCSGRLLPGEEEAYDFLLLHLCLPEQDGLRTGDVLFASCPVCPPRVVFAAPAEWCVHRPLWADCTVDAGVSPAGLCALLQILAQKSVPQMAMAQQEPLSLLVERFLDDLSFKKSMKGRNYAAWILKRMAPSSLSGERPLRILYEECARFFATTPAAVERCLRVAVESVFTQGDLQAIERFFGATVDPERGKPTNRAFLMQAVQQLRYSLATARSLNSSEMHHSPAAPTSV